MKKNTRTFGVWGLIFNRARDGEEKWIGDISIRSILRTPSALIKKLLFLKYLISGTEGGLWTRPHIVSLSISTAIVHSSDQKYYLIEIL